MEIHPNSKLVDDIKNIGRLAGSVLIKYSNSESNDISWKQDNSPVTLADKESDRIIFSGLKLLTPQIPIISEESSQPPYEVRKDFQTYWLVDPLDGTKEFIKGLHESCVCIALIKNNEVLFSLIDDPFSKRQYYAIKGKGAFECDYDGLEKKIHVQKHEDGHTAKIYQSRSKPIIDHQLIDGDPIQWVPMGSALKFCQLARGEVHLYFRWSPFMEWDAAAGQLIASEAGARVTDLHGQPISYNTESLLLQGIIVDAKPWPLSEILALRNLESD